MENIFKVSTQRKISNGSTESYSPSGREISRFWVWVLDGALNVWKLSFLLGSLRRGFEIGPWEFCLPGLCLETERERERDRERERNRGREAAQHLPIDHPSVAGLDDE